MSIIKRISSITLLGLIASSIQVFSALAESTTQNNSSNNPTGLIGILVIALCLSKRKQAIGGWLLYYFIQVFLGLLFTIFFTLIGIANYNPALWDDQYRYGLFIISTLPNILIELCLTGVSLRLLIARTWKWVRATRYVLIASIVCVLIACIIDYFYFPTSLPLDIYSLIFPSIFLSYFYMSKRVKHVFETHDWVPEMATGGKIQWYWWNKEKELGPQSGVNPTTNIITEDTKNTLDIAEYTSVGFFRRLAAGMIDLFLLATTSLLIGRFVDSGIIIAFYWMLYFAITQSSRLSASLGKFALDIKVTDMAGRRLTFIASTVYAITFYALSIFTLWTNFIPVAFNKNKQALHDRICKIMVLTPKLASEAAFVAP